MDRLRDGLQKQQHEAQITMAQTAIEISAVIISTNCLFRSENDANSTSTRTCSPCRSAYDMPNRQIGDIKCHSNSCDQTEPVLKP